MAGPLRATTVLVAGTHRDFRAWDFFGPLSTRPGRMRLGAQTLFLNGFTALPGLPSALAELGTLQAGNDRDEADGCWTLVDTDVVRPFPEAFRDGRVVDGKGLFVGTLESEAFADLLVQAHFTSAAAFHADARHDLTYAQVFAEPARYRGVVMHVRGRLARLSRLDPPLAAKAQGVSDQFEAWVFYDLQGLNPFCCIFTELPASLRRFVGQERLADREVEVAFDGYFYKKFRYKAADSKPSTARDAPVFVGRALVLLTPPAPPAEPDDWGTHMMLVFVGVVAFVVAAGVALTWWFRRSDERVRRRLRDAREPGVVLPEPGVGAAEEEVGDGFRRRGGPNGASPHF
jgi:hypothetical protein